jgi:hypothetical protein
MCPAGVACGNDVQVLCTISSVTVSVPGCYRLQLFLPFRINDEAESVKFSSKKQPPTLTVTLAVDSSIARPAGAAAAACAPQAQPASADAGAFRQSSSSSTGSEGTRQLRSQQQQQQQQQRPRDPLNTSFPGTFSARVSEHAQLASAVAGPMSGDRSTWLWPYAVVADWLDSSGADAARKSLLWRLKQRSASSPGAAPVNVLPLTARNVVLALLATLLGLVMKLSANAFTLVGMCVPLFC